jgi:NarL family two-component system response regulator LiaR
MTALRLLIADDHRLFRQGLRQMCEIKGGFEVVGEAENGRQAVELAGRLKPDVVLMDIQMPELDGVEATRQITLQVPETRVIVLTMFRQDNYVFEAIKAGARGYLLKDTDWHDLLEAVRAVQRGEALINAAMAARVLDEFRRQSWAPVSSEKAEALNSGEMDILLLLAQGLDNQAIAEKLSLSEKTITNRLSDIYGKLHVNNRTQAALYALRRGWAKLDLKDKEDKEDKE